MANKRPRRNGPGTQKNAVTPISTCASFDTPEALRERWAASWAILFGELAALTPSDLTRTVMLRNKEMDALQALNNAHGHYAMHVGQIMMLGKYLTGDDWQVLSIPKGKSEEFFGRK